MAKNNFSAPPRTQPEFATPIELTPTVSLEPKIVKPTPSIRLVSCDKHEDVAMYQTSLSAGCDICTSTGFTLRSGEILKVSTNTRLLVSDWVDPPGFVTYAQLHPRSSLRKIGVSFMGVGIIDLDYTGEIIVYITNHNTNSVRINAGDRIGQIIFGLAVRPFGIPISDACRSGGAGSTGGGAFIKK